MIDNKKRFYIEDYGMKPTFANFLSGVSGAKGIPVWCHYVNRGQAISCFGVEDKDHAIMEFFPAHQAYQNTKRLGFRTFLKIDGKIIEAFSKTENKQTMYTGMNELEITENNQEAGLNISVRYYTLPGEEVGALVRTVTIENIDEEEKEIEILDGMPALIPYGVNLAAIKEMGQTAKAWMEVLDHKTNIPFFHVRASMEDTAIVTEIEGGNFAFAYTSQGEGLPVLINTENVFAYDTSLERALAFEQEPVDTLMTKSQITKNIMPCCFFGKAFKLGPKEKFVINEVYGQADSKEIIKELSKKAAKEGYFDRKYNEAVALTEELTTKIQTKTGSEIFDLYCRQTYLDNVLRGGFPTILGKDKTFYLYSRKHGDMERDYNYFKMLPEFYSQGNGNFRDVNQNRRCDVQFTPFVEDVNIKLFYNCIQINGYNPLGIEKTTYYLEKAKAEEIGQFIAPKDEVDFKAFIQRSFTPGSLYKQIKRCELQNDVALEEVFNWVIDQAVSENKTDFMEGYWTDHWTYNLDLIEAYLSIYPDREKELIFDDKTYTYLESKANILPRRKRYKKTDNGIRQYQFLDENEDTAKSYLTDQAGNIVQANLAQKLLLLSIVKFGALDPYGMGLEMEGGKPGWYDALNGLPGLLGSSMAETYELARNVEFTLEMMKKHKVDVNLLEELGEFAKQTLEIIEDNKAELAQDKPVMNFWNQLNDAKEQYREKTKDTVTGKYTSFSSDQICTLLESYLAVLTKSIEKALKIGQGICPTYFYYDVTKYHEGQDGIHIIEVEMQKMPHFLEGPVRYFKLKSSKEDKLELYNKVKASGLYDEKLNMYRVNDSLEESTYELGRARAFTPGWLENGSIWLHMEYKYLLGLLKAGLYKEYLDDFKLAAVPFQDPDVYGRSLLENSSFIASSVNPNQAIHGKGFVARLSGSTVEFLNMWQIMMFGQAPFVMKGQSLCVAFAPVFPAYLIGEDLTIEAVFLGQIPVVYHLADREDHIPGNYEIRSYKVTLNGEEKIIPASYICGDLSKKIRNMEVDKIELYLERIK